MTTTTALDGLNTLCGNVCVAVALQERQGFGNNIFAVVTLSILSLLLLTDALLALSAINTTVHLQNKLEKAMLTYEGSKPQQKRVTLPRLQPC